MDTSTPGRTPTGTADVTTTIRVRRPLGRALLSAAVTCVVPLAVAGVNGLQLLDPFEPSPSIAVADNTSQFPDRHQSDALDPNVEPVALSRTVEIDPTTGGVVVPSSEKRVTELSAAGDLDIPAAALAAYRAAAATLARTDPSCNIDWALLAGIGRVESHHGRYGGAQVAANGKTYPHILGLALDGSPGLAAIPDTDGGRLDSDTTWDRAVGPMQFIPTTWAMVAADGDGDGESDPHDLDDAALAAGTYLCAGSHDVSTRAGAEAAVFSYNHSDEYVAMVLAIAAAYRNGEIHLPTPPGGWGHGSAPTLDTVPTAGRNGEKAASGRTADKKAKPARDSLRSPKKKPPKFIPADGVLSNCGDSGDGTWCIGGKAFDFGTAQHVRTMQASDYDGSGTVEPIVDELTALAGSHVTAEVRNTGRKTTIHTLQGLPYRDSNGVLLGTPAKPKRANNPSTNSGASTPPEPKKTTTPPDPEETTTPPKPEETTTPPDPDETTTPPEPEETTTPSEPDPKAKPSAAPVDEPKPGGAASTDAEGDDTTS